MAKDVADLRKFLPSIAIFGGLEPATLERVIAMLVEHRCETGTVVCKQGDTGRELFVLRHGEVVVSRQGETGRRVKVVRLGEGEFFGEMTLIDIQKRSATVTVEKPSLLYTLSNRDLYTLYVEDTPGYVMVLQNLCRELSRRLRTTNARLTQMAVDADDDSTQIRPSVKRRPPI